eukprot:CAMPEP_0184355506 /NCGR_PEP_ID=MMETSP1089-20130417/96564_1 /TAXON_ID=38269 ORGANISM="Gloeochaete wittrockiana, Strain SAG46.84" /NCGR_SAMPLE_ID=MMETSP1089 /ASSEMBLY_ACC=CAM_ASM_000445 /LENGTH=31 /DNA_ID= /DNA_START= /DNA_END= /DNA_ORIENTATION=
MGLIPECTTGGGGGAWKLPRATGHVEGAEDK